MTSLFRSFFFQSAQSTAYILPCGHGCRQQGPTWTDSSEPLPQAHVVAHTHAASVLACMWGAATACIWPATAHGASLCTYTSHLTCTVVLPSCHLSDPCELFAPTSPHHHLSLTCMCTLAMSHSPYWLIPCTMLMFSLLVTLYNGMHLSHGFFMHSHVISLIEPQVEAIPVTQKGKRTKHSQRAPVARPRCTTRK